ELGLQQRSLEDTWLFVLPSTSPANAAVSYAERLRWFAAFRATLALEGPHRRRAARALVVDPSSRVLLVEFREPRTGDVFWATPGGGVAPGESHEQALCRELVEEAGLDDVEVGRCVWTRDELFAWGDRLLRQEERFFLVRVDPFEVRPALDAAALREEGLHGSRWWTLDEIESSGETFYPRRLAPLLRGLLRDGPPSEPIDAGV
ncbi:MAG: NUDIX domain-containing protein, partial [Actinomycetota bacterium]|nr:NUDIX domain-containing protein [Actinomycetota bacterium]